MLTNTGTLSFVLYGIFIVITIIGLFAAIYFIMKDKIPPDKLEKLIELFKYTVVTVCIATVTLIVSDLFKEREQDVKELEYFGKYVDDVKKADGLTERYLLSRYLSIVAPSGELKNSWRQYHDTLKTEYVEYIRLKREQEKLDTIKNPTQEQMIRKQEVDEKVEQKETPLVGTYGNLTPRVYIRISGEDQRTIAKSLESTLKNERFLVPNIATYGNPSNNYRVPKTEVRYYRDEELADAIRLISILKSHNLGLQINDDPQRVSGTGRGTRSGHFEIWFSRS